MRTGYALFHNLKPIGNDRDRLHKNKIASRFAEIKMPKEVTIYCDESTASGKHYSDFYGGILVGSNNAEKVAALIAAKKSELNLFGEVKWTKITEAYAEKYIALVDLVFDLAAANKLKIRIMFTQNMYKALGLSEENKDNKYFLLYYQFIKNAFGLKYVAPTADGLGVRVYLDKMPDKAEKVEDFRNFVAALTTSADFKAANVFIKKENVTEVISHEHDLLQCLDIILGSMQFQLNDLHKEIPAGKRRRGKRTVAKEKVYKHINARVRQLRPGFNIGVSTGSPSLKDRWRHAYRHWLFIPTNHKIEKGVGKRKKAP